MSKGNRVITVRIEQELLDEIDAVISKRNLHSYEAAWCTSDFIRAALIEKLRKMERSRTRSKPQEQRCTRCGLEGTWGKYYHVKSELDNDMQTLCPTCIRETEGLSSPP